MSPATDGREEGAPVLSGAASAEAGVVVSGTAGPAGGRETVRVTDSCTACGACLATCPERALRRAPKRPLVVDAACTACWACIEMCPAGAIVSALAPAAPALPGPSPTEPATTSVGGRQGSPAPLLRSASAGGRAEPRREPLSISAKADDGRSTRWPAVTAERP